MVANNFFFFQYLTDFLQDFRKVLLLGLGNDLRGDDAVGLYLIDQLKNKITSPHIEFLKVYTVLENFWGKIISLKPSRIILFDAYACQKDNAKIRLVADHEIDLLLPSTHSFAPHFLLDKLKREIACQYIVIGIPGFQFPYLERKISDKTKKYADDLCRIIYRNLSKQ